MNLDNYAGEAALFKTLNHPIRLAILDILRGDEACVCHLEAILKLRQAYISQQLMILREAGLVMDRREGMNIFYRANKPGVYDLIDHASQMIEAASTQRLVKPTMTNVSAACECPKCKTRIPASTASAQ